MSRKGGHKDKRIAQAAAFKMRCRDASIPEAMRACEFTLAESSNPAKQMAVRRAYEKAIGPLRCHRLQRHALAKLLPPLPSWPLLPRCRRAAAAAATAAVAFVSIVIVVAVIVTVSIAIDAAAFG
jgi:hypothetical protein